MDNSRYKNMKIFLGVLLALTVILFFFQNFGIKMLTESARTQYYVATQDIAANTMIDASMITSVEVESDDVLSGLITNDELIVGRYTTENISRGEYISEYLITADNSESELVYTIEITSDYSGPLQYDDFVDIYTLDKDNTTALLFSRKKLYSANGQVLSNTSEDGTITEQSVDKKYIKVTKQELQEYYTKLKTHSIIVVPINGEFDATSDDSSTQTSTNTTVDVFTWTVKEGETWESIAEDYNTTATVLQQLNAGVELEEGINIKIPQED